MAAVAGIRRLLRHRVDILRPSEGAEDEWGQPIQVYLPIAIATPALIQERTGREVAMTHQQGPVVITAVTFFPYTTDVTERDRIYRPSTGRTYEVLYVKDAAGWSHHFEVDCQLIEPAGTMPRAAALAHAQEIADLMGVSTEQGGVLGDRVIADMIDGDGLIRFPSAPAGTGDTAPTDGDRPAPGGPPKYTEGPPPPPDEEWA